MHCGVVNFGSLPDELLKLFAMLEVGSPLLAGHDIVRLCLSKRDVMG